MALVYSCCFWFSLRLGGILIGIFSLALLILTASCLAYSHSQSVMDEITNWTYDLNLIYAKEYLENIKSDPAKYLSLSISFTCAYIIVCIMFIYGAYTSVCYWAAYCKQMVDNMSTAKNLLTNFMKIILETVVLSWTVQLLRDARPCFIIDGPKYLSFLRQCNNMLMVTYILIELLRLVLLSILVATSLLLIKQNTMDIGLLIGASVAGGFFLLGMFYLWICVANLPILINEMKHDEQAAIINKLRQLLEANHQSSGLRGFENVPFAAGAIDAVNRDVFIVPPQRTRDKPFKKN